jgi:hypothetical protein
MGALLPEVLSTKPLAVVVRERLVMTLLVQPLVLEATA